MNFPDFLPTERQFSFPSGGARPFGARAHPALSGLTIALQEKENWCWAAVTVGIRRFFYPNVSLSQCGVATATLEVGDCCTGAADCDRAYYLDVALSKFKTLREFVRRAMSFDEVDSEITQSRPVCSRVAWTIGGGHFQVISGSQVTDSGVEFLTILDPLYGRLEIRFDAFASGYIGGGTWTHSYLTTPDSDADGVGGAAGVVDPTAIGGGAT